MKKWLLVCLLLAGCVDTSQDVSMQGSSGFVHQYLGEDFTAYGRLENLTDGRIVMQAEVINCKLNRTKLVVQAEPTSDVELGKDYFIRFMLQDRLRAIFALQGLEPCQDVHLADLYPWMVSGYAPYMSVIKQDLLSIGEPYDFDVTVVNVAGQDLEYEVLDASIHDYYLIVEGHNFSQSLIEDCDVTFPQGKIPIKARSNSTFIITASCDYPTDCTREVLDCYSGECITRNLAACEFALWADICFEDELGFEHTIPLDVSGNGIIKRNIQIKPPYDDW